MNEENMKLWDSVCKTDPKHTKAAKIGQMSITAIAPQYQRKMATEKFGPYGQGWGVQSEEWMFIDFENKTKLGLYSAILWYDYNGKRGELPITSNVKVCYVTKSGQGYLMVDDEFAKKGQTDALTKGLSTLGFNADVFMGLYDDSKYVNQMREEFADKPADVITKIGQAKTVQELQAVWAGLPAEMKKREDVTVAKDAKKLLLTPTDK